MGAGAPPPGVGSRRARLAPSARPDEPSSGPFASRSAEWAGGRGRRGRRPPSPSELLPSSTSLSTSSSSAEELPPDDAGVAEPEERDAELPEAEPAGAPAAPTGRVVSGALSEEPPGVAEDGADDSDDDEEDMTAAQAERGGEGTLGYGNRQRRAALRGNRVRRAAKATLAPAAKRNSAPRSQGSSVCRRHSHSLRGYGAWGSARWPCAVVVRENKGFSDNISKFFQEVAYLVCQKPAVFVLYMYSTARTRFFLTASWSHASFRRCLAYKRRPPPCQEMNPLARFVAVT